MVAWVNQQKWADLQIALLKEKPSRSLSEWLRDCMNDRLKSEMEGKSAKELIAELNAAD